MRILYIVSICILITAICHSVAAPAAGLASPTSRTKPRKGFAIYLLARGVESTQLSKVDIDHLGIDRLKEVWSSSGLRAISDDEQQLVLEESLMNREERGGRTFSLLLRPDGTAAYFGFNGVEKLGHYSGAYPRDEYSRLCELFLLKLHSLTGSGVFYEPRTLGIVYRGELKIIPNNLRGTSGNSFVVEKAFDDLAARIKWTREPVGNSSGIRGTANVSDLTQERGLTFNVFVTFAGGQNGISSQTLTGKGEFQLNLPPGIYRVFGGTVWQNRPPMISPPRSKPQFVVVEAGKFTQVTIKYLKPGQW